MTNKKRRKKSLLLPAPKRSAHLYVQINPSQVHLFRFFLEAEENLGIMSVVDRRRAVLQIRFSPHQEVEMRLCLERMQQSLPFTIEDAWCIIT